MQDSPYSRATPSYTDLSPRRRAKRAAAASAPPWQGRNDSSITSSGMVRVEIIVATGRGTQPLLGDRLMAQTSGRLNLYSHRSGSYKGTCDSTAAVHVGG